MSDKPKRVLHCMDGKTDTCLVCNNTADVGVGRPEAYAWPLSVYKKLLVSHWQFTYITCRKVKCPRLRKKLGIQAK